MNTTGLLGQQTIEMNIETSPVWYQVMDPSGRVTCFNNYAQEVSGYSFDELRSSNLFWEKLFRRKETGLRLLTLYQIVVKHGRDIRSKVSEITTKSGRKVKICWTLTCNKTEPGLVTGATMIGILLDQVTEIKEKKSSFQDDRYREIFRNAPIGFFRSLPEGRFVEVNNALAELLGYKTPEEVLTEITQIGDDIYQQPEFRNKIIEETLGSGKVNSFETIFLDRNRNPIDIRINISSRYDPGLDHHILEGTIENISARKAAERKLQENLNKYTTLFEESPISIWEIDYSEMYYALRNLQVSPDNIKDYFHQNPERLKEIRQLGKVIDVNRESVNLFGLDSKASLLDLHQNLLDAPLTEVELKSMKCFLTNQNSFEHETTIQASAKGPRNIILRWAAAPRTNKPYSRVLVSMIDITEQRNEHEALRKSKNELATLLSSMDDLVFILNKEGKYIYVAPTRPDLLISSPNKLIGKNITEYLNKDLGEKYLNRISESISKKVTISFDYPLIIKGREYWFEAKISPLSDENVIVVARDISQRITNNKANEVMLNVARAVGSTDRLDELFDLIRLEISKIIDTRNFFLALFDARTNILELPYFKDEKDNFDHFPAEKTISAIVIKEKRSMLLHEPEIHQLKKEGKINFIGSVAKVWLGIPLMVEGEVLGLMVVQDYENENAISKEHQNVLEMISPQISLSIRRKQNEQLLRESEKQLRESNETKDRFFNIIAHDLKNPFNAIIGFTSLLADEWNDFDDDDKISMISSIKSSSEGAFELLMNLLEWSRLQVGKMTFEPEFIDYSSLIRLNLSLLRTAAEKKNIKLITSGACDKMIWADPNMIKTVIRNLITNAIKFTPANGTVTIKCFKSQEYPEKMLISIKDNGVGMSQLQTDSLFTLSSSQSRTGTDGETGTGLGLVLCKEFVEKNHGKIWVESETGKGSTFFVALPDRPIKS